MFARACQIAENWELQDIPMVSRGSWPTLLRTELLLTSGPSVGSQTICFESNGYGKPKCKVAWVFQISAQVEREPTKSDRLHL